MKAKATGPAQRRIRLLVVDDREVACAGLGELLVDSHTIELAGTATTAAAAVPAMRRLSPDVVLMSMLLPDGSGIAACRDILSERPATRVLLLTGYADDEAASAVLFGGAAGYLVRDIGHRSLHRAIEAVIDGQAIFDARLLQAATDRVKALMNPPETRRHTDLSPQESRILGLVVEGKTNRQIAAALDLSAKTVKNYLSNAFQKLHVARRSQAAAVFTRQTDGTIAPG